MSTCSGARRPGDPRAPAVAARRRTERRDLARDPDHREQVGAVHRRRHVEHLVDERQHVGERRPRLEPVGQQHDPVVVGAEADLVLGEDHPARHLAAQRPLLERPGEAGQERAGEADRDRRAGAEVPRAADDLLRVGVARRRPGRAGAGRRSGAARRATTRPTTKCAEVAALVRRRRRRSPARPRATRSRDGARSPRASPASRRTRGASRAGPA